MLDVIAADHKLTILKALAGLAQLAHVSELAGYTTAATTLEGRPGMSDVSPLSGISALSSDSTLLFPPFFFCLLPLLFLSCLFFLPTGPFS